MSVIMYNQKPTTVSAAHSASFLEVIDPVNRTGKIVVPMMYIHETKGMNELTRPKDAKDLSLCLLFQKGRCNAGARCHQIHAEPSFVEKLRNQANTGASCCALHGDFNSASYLTAGLTVELMSNGIAAKYSLQSFGRTSTMDLMTSTAAGNYSKSVRMNVNKVCRLHAQSRCKFGKDCKNVHMCPNAKSLSTSSTSAASIAAPAAPIAPLPGFARPIEQAGALKATGPLGSSSASTFLNTANRKMKSAPGLDVSRSELASSSCSVSFGLSSCPSTPGDLAQSNRSLSVESASSSASVSASHQGLSPNSLTPLESPKETPFATPAAAGLFNRNVCVSPAPIAMEEPPVAQAPIFASTTDTVVRKTGPLQQAAPLTVSELVAAIWEAPLQTQAASGPSPLVGDGFEHTMSLLAKDLTGLTCSPSWSQ